MTKFDELVDIITRNKNRNKKSVSEDKDDNKLVEVAGAESTKNPLVEFGDSETDPDLLDQLHRSPKLKPNDGFGSESWD